MNDQQTNDQTPLPQLHAAPRPEAASMAWKAGDVVLGGYRVEGTLGQGGFGKVWRLLDPSNGARFAVKRASHRDVEARRKFLHELLHWADLPPHPNLLPLRFFRTDGDEVFLFSDCAADGSLTDWIRGGRLTTLEAILDAAVQFAWGLHVAHEHGMVHQDVKPANALMNDGRVLVGDFGLAKSKVALEGDEPTDPCVSSGGMTRAYCSPEQANRQPLTRQTDVWSWGLSVLEAFGDRGPNRVGQRPRQRLHEQGQRPANAGAGQAALPLCDRAIAILARLVEQEGRSELLGDLICVRLNRIDTARTLGDSPETIQSLVREQVALLRHEIERTGIADLL